MKTQHLKIILTRTFIIFSSVALIAVSMMAFHDPQEVMNLVQVKLTSTDAYSSIRGVYGGVGLTIVLTMCMLLRKQVKLALTILCLLWGLYAASRLLTIVLDGPLGAFGTQWLYTETILFGIAASLRISLRNSEA